MNKTRVIQHTNQYIKHFTQKEIKRLYQQTLSKTRHIHKNKTQAMQRKRLVQNNKSVHKTLYAMTNQTNQLISILREHNTRIQTVQRKHTNVKGFTDSATHMNIRKDSSDIHTHQK